MWKKKAQEAQTEPAGQETSRKKEEGRDLYEWTQALVCSVLAVVLLFTFVVRLIGVDGHSMVPTLQDGDRLLVLNSCWMTTISTATSWCCGRIPS